MLLGVVQKKFIIEMWESGGGGRDIWESPEGTGPDSTGPCVERWGGEGKGKGERGTRYSNQEGRGTRRGG